MRAELAQAVGGLIGNIDGTGIAYSLDEGRIGLLVDAANVVTHARTAVERDFRGDVVEAHAPEAPTRLAKQLAQLMRGGVAIGMEPGHAMQLALRCARDCIPQGRLAILLDLAEHPRSRATDVSRNITRPYRTTRREVEALHMLGLLQCEEEKAEYDESKTVWRYSLAEALDRDVLLSLGGRRLV
jgi:hypothetical protein